MQIRRLSVWIRLPNGADRLDATQTRFATGIPPRCLANSNSQLVSELRPVCFLLCSQTRPPLLPDTTASAPRRIRLCPQTRLRLLPRSLREIDHETATIDADFQGPFHQLPATFLLISWKRGLLPRRFVHREIRNQKRFTSKEGVSKRVTENPSASLCALQKQSRPMDKKEITPNTS